MFARKPPEQRGRADGAGTVSARTASREDELVVRDPMRSWYLFEHGRRRRVPDPTSPCFTRTMTSTTVLASCAVGNVDCHDTASVDLLPLLVVVGLVVVALVVLGITLLGRQRR